MNVKAAQRKFIVIITVLYKKSFSVPFFVDFFDQDKHQEYQNTQRKYTAAIVTSPMIFVLTH